MAICQCLPIFKNFELRLRFWLLSNIEIVRRLISILKLNTPKQKNRIQKRKKETSAVKEIQDLTRQYSPFSKPAMFWKKSDWHSHYLISEIEVVVSNEFSLRPPWNRDRFASTRRLGVFLCIFTTWPCHFLFMYILKYSKEAFQI